MLHVSVLEVFPKLSMMLKDRGCNLSSRVVDGFVIFIKTFITLALHEEAGSVCSSMVALGIQPLRTDMQKSEVNNIIYVYEAGLF